MARVVSIALALFLVIGVILFVQYDEARVTATDTQQPAPPTKHDAALDSTVRPYVSETETSRTPEAHSGASMINARTMAKRFSRTVRAATSSRKRPCWRPRQPHSGCGPTASSTTIWRRTGQS